MALLRPCVPLSTEGIVICGELQMQHHQIINKEVFLCFRRKSQKYSGTSGKKSKRKGGVKSFRCIQKHRCRRSCIDLQPVKSWDDISEWDDDRAYGLFYLDKFKYRPGMEGKPYLKALPLIPYEVCGWSYGHKDTSNSHI